MRIEEYSTVEGLMKKVRRASDDSGRGHEGTRAKRPKLQVVSEHVKTT
jgi:hypothetical protein